MLCAVVYSCFYELGTVFFLNYYFSFRNSLATKSEFLKKCKFSFVIATLPKFWKLNLFYLMKINNVKFEVKFFTLSIALKN